MKTKTAFVTTSEFETRCLELLESVSKSDGCLVVMRDGRALVRITSATARPAAGLEGSIVREGDLVSPLGDAWTAEA